MCGCAHTMPLGALIVVVVLVEQVEAGSKMSVHLLQLICGILWATRVTVRILGVGW